MKKLGLCCCWLLLACKTINGRKTETRQHTEQMENSLSTRSSALSANYTWQTDSSSLQRQVVIFPDGQFNWSPQTGYQGKASKVALNEYRQLAKRQVKMASEAREADSAVTIRNTKASTHQLQQRQSKRSTWASWFLALVLLLALGWFVGRRFRLNW